MISTIRRWLGRWLKSECYDADIWIDDSPSTIPSLAAHTKKINGKMVEWISVVDRLPPENVLILAAGKNLGRYESGIRLDICLWDGDFLYDDGGTELHGLGSGFFSHWGLLPEEPIEWGSDRISNNPEENSSSNVQHPTEENGNLSIGSPEDWREFVDNNIGKEEL